MLRHVVFLCDASIDQGAGHVMRCLGLAEELSTLGFKITFVADTKEIPWLTERLHSSGFDLVSPEFGKLFEQVSAIHPDVIVIDSYEDQSILSFNFRSLGCRVVAIVDGATPPMLADLAISPGPISTFQNVYPKHASGVEMAFHRADVIAAGDRRQAEYKATDFDVLQCLVSLGGSGASDLISADVYQALLPKFAQISGVHFKILGDATHICRVLDESGIDDFGLDVVPLGSGFFSETIQADVALTSAGVTSLEFLAIGIPSIVIQTASNQCDNVAILEHLDSVIFLGGVDHLLLDDGATESLQRAFDEYRSRLEGEFEFERFPRDGASRAAEHICDLLRSASVSPSNASTVVASEIEKVELCGASPKWSVWLWENRFAPEIRDVSVTKNFPTLAEHLKWLDSPKGQASKVILVDGVPAGSLRIDQVDGDDELNVSIFVASKFRGNNLGPRALRLAEVELIEGRVIVAEIQSTNRSSRRMFEKAGYLLDSESQGWMKMRREVGSTV